MIQQIAETSHNGQTEAKAAAAFARRVIELMVLLEDRVKFALWDSDSGVADFDAYRSFVSAATE
jgi:hypothetical protein